jgi:hypothetical protein
MMIGMAAVRGSLRTERQISRPSTCWQHQIEDQQVGRAFRDRFQRVAAGREQLD